MIDGGMQDYIKSSIDGTIEHGEIKDLIAEIREQFTWGKNYDENGTLLDTIKNKRQPTEPGNWRVEVSPVDAKRDDEFLVVLIPRTLHAAFMPRIRQIKSGNEYGVEISGTTTRNYWFSAERNGVRLEELGSSETIFAADQAIDMDKTAWAKFRNWWRDLF